MTQDLREKIARLVRGAFPEPDEELKELLDELQPYDIAAVMPGLSEAEQILLLGMLSSDIAAETLEHLDPEEQYPLLDHMADETARAILMIMSSDALTDLVTAIHPKQADQVLRVLSQERQGHIRSLMAYPEESAGGLMSTNYLAIRQEWTCQQATAHFRKIGRDVDVTNYFYVVGKDGRLVGVTSMRDIFLSPPEESVTEAMFTKIIAVSATADQEEAARLLSHYDFVAIPVVDGTGRMVGVITADDVIDVIEEEATEDIQTMGGTLPLDEPYLEVTLFGMYRKRVGWLLFLFVAALLTSNILQYYEEFLDQVIALAFFIPLLIDTGGNSGSQAATLLIRAMALGEVTFTDFVRVVWREAQLGVALGATMAVAVFLRAYLMGGGLELGLTVAATISLIVITGSTIGAALPLIGRKIGFDPALFSAPVITTVADVSGLIIYFQMARVFMGLGA